jgi:hypothetical protein
MENEKLSGFTEVKSLCGISTFYKNLPPANESTKSKFLEDKDYPKSINDFLEKKKKEIPLYDPQTGEPNYQYEKLTGKKNPLIQTDKMLIPLIEPKLENRFLVHFPKDLNIHPWAIREISDINITKKIKKIFGIKIKEEVIIDNIFIKIMELITINPRKNIEDYFINNKIFNVVIEELDPTGAVIGSKELVDCIIKDIKFNDLKYYESDSMKIMIVIKPKKIKFK